MYPIAIGSKSSGSKTRAARTVARLELPREKQNASEFQTLWNLLVLLCENKGTAKKMD